jgi:hypothetical protein
MFTAPREPFGILYMHETVIDRTFVVITEWPARSPQQRSVVAADMHEALRIVQSDPACKLASGVSVRERT